MINKHRLIRGLVLSLFISLGLTGCGSQKSPNSSSEQSITVSGAFALYPMMTRWAEEFQKIHPEVRFDVSAGGAGKGMADALAGAVEIGMVSRDITPEEEAKGAFWVAVTKDAVFVTFNENNPVKDDLLLQGITQDILVKIFITGEIKTWGEVVGKPEVTDEIHVYTRSDACGAAEALAKYLGKKQEDLLGIGVFGDPGVTEAVAKDPLGMGYNNLGYAYDASSGKPIQGILILPIDVDGNHSVDAQEVLDTKAQAIEAVAANHYPSPPARVLNLVTLGKPSGVVAQFIQWILTDGQQFVGEAGYVQLAPEQLSEQLQKLK
ncbi:MAG: PstS family phosphate ABC transporter substrate-binding protein [Chloroflexota bacterium]